MTSSKKIKPGMMCYLLYTNPRRVARSCRHLNGCAVVEVAAYLGKKLRKSGETVNVWRVRHENKPYCAYETILQPIPPDELEQLRQQNRDLEKEDAHED